MEEKERRDLGKRESGEKEPVFSKQKTPDRPEERIAAPESEQEAKPFRTDNGADFISGNMPDKGENTVSASDYEERSSVFRVPDFVRAAESAPDEKTDTGTLLLSEIREPDPPGNTDEDDMTVDPNATTLNSPLDDTDLSAGRLPEKDHSSGDRKKNGKCSFDPSTVFAPGGNLDAISLLEPDTEESAFSAFPDMQTDRKKFISELAFEQETGEDGSAFNTDAAVIFKSPGETDFDFVRREEEFREMPDRFPGADMEQRTADFQTDSREPESQSPDDNSGEKIQSLPPEEEMQSSDSDADLIHPILSETVRDKSGQENNEPESRKPDVLSLGAAFITEIPEETAADPDALTMIMRPEEFEERGLKVNGKTAENKSAYAPAEKDGEEPFELSEIPAEEKSEQIPVIHLSKEENMPFDLSEIPGEEKSEQMPEQKKEDTPFDLSEILPEQENKPVSDSEIKAGKNTASEKFLSESGDDSVFDLNTQNIADTDADLGKPDVREVADSPVPESETDSFLSSFLESPAAEDEQIFDLGAEAMVEAEDEISAESGENASLSESGEENFDADAETIVASAADILGLSSGNLLEPPSETDTADRDEEMDELLMRDADEGLPDLDSILDAAKEDSSEDYESGDYEDIRTSEKKENISPEEGLSAMDILKSMGSPELGEEYGGTDNAIGIPDMPEAKSLKLSPEEDPFFHVPDTDAKTEPMKKISKPLRPPARREIKAGIKNTGKVPVHTSESEPLYDNLAGKYYFSLSPVQIESAIERIISRIFSAHIERVIREVVREAVEEEMRKFRDGIIEEIAEGDKL